MRRWAFRDTGKKREHSMVRRSRSLSPFTHSSRTILGRSWSRKVCPPAQDQAPACSRALLVLFPLLGCSSLPHSTPSNPPNTLQLNHHPLRKATQIPQHPAPLRCALLQDTHPGCRARVLLPLGCVLPRGSVLPCLFMLISPGSGTG